MNSGEAIKIPMIGELQTPLLLGSLAALHDFMEKSDRVIGACTPAESFGACPGALLRGGGARGAGS